MKRTQSLSIPILSAILLFSGGCGSQRTAVTPLPEVATTRRPVDTPPEPRTAAPVTDAVPAEIAALAPIAKPALEAPTQLPLMYVAASDLNLRSGPGTSFDSIFRLQRGSTVQVKGVNSDKSQGQWTHVIADNRTGWVASQYLVKEKSQLINGDYSNLDYSAIDKSGFPGNPKRDIRAVYLTINSANSGNLDRILEQIRGTRVNALVIDVKDDSGFMLHRSEVAARHAPGGNTRNQVKDIAAFTKRLHDAGLYLIARVVTFKDPVYSKAHPEHAIVRQGSGEIFKSKDGLRWATPFSADFQRYNLEIAVEAAKAGFNEIQFDYVRFPVEFAADHLDYRNTRRESKAFAIQRFLLDARAKLKPHSVYISADVFGLVGTAKDDMNIGQYWEAISAAVDYISPMIYPSHYANNSYGLRIPDKQPYELMKRAVRDGLNRNQPLETPAEIRPWIQDFTASWLSEYQKYGVPEVRAQIRAMEENGVSSWLVWNASNRYSYGAF